MNPTVTVIVPTHAPDSIRLERVLRALREQNFDHDSWELIVVDNATPVPVSTKVVRTAHPEGRVVPEPLLGLTNARARGIAEARGEMLIFVDDDNVLATDYLKEAVQFLTLHPSVGALGGSIEAEFEASPPAWVLPHLTSLAIRDLGPDDLISDPAAGCVNEYPYFAPLGAGLIVRRTAALRYLTYLAEHGTLLSDRRGQALKSSGDCELVQHAALLAGQAVAYTPRLRLTHLIPAARLRFSYLSRLNYVGGVCWTQFQRRYGFASRISALTVPPRVVRAFLRSRGWTRAGFIRWCLLTGQFVGRAFD